MKNVLGVLTLTTVLSFAVTTMAADKVVVIPLSGKKTVNVANFTGVWQPSTSYQAGQTVQIDGSTYVALTNHTSDPTTPDMGNWSLMAAKGDKGDPGTDGADGAPGVSPNQTCVYPEVMIGIDLSGNIKCTDPTQKIVFVTSLKYNGNLGGLAGADQKCQTLANNAGVYGEFKAWLSDSVESPSTRFVQSTAPYVLVNGTVIATNWADINDGSLIVPINIYENGGTASTTGSGQYVWTGAIGSNCNDWAVDLSTEIGLVGWLASSDSIWSNYSQAPCDAFLRLYCIQQ